MKIPEVRLSLTEESIYLKAIKQMKPQLINDPGEIRALALRMTEIAKLKNKILYKALKNTIPIMYKLLSISSAPIFPLISNGKQIGVLDISRKKPFNHSDMERFKTICRPISISINKKITGDRLKSSIHESDMIIETGIDGMRLIDKDFNV